MDRKIYKLKFCGTINSNSNVLSNELYKHDKMHFLDVNDFEHVDEWPVGLFNTYVAENVQYCKGYLLDKIFSICEHVSDIHNAMNAFIDAMGNQVDAQDFV